MYYLWDVIYLNCRNYYFLSKFFWSCEAVVRSLILTSVWLRASSSPMMEMFWIFTLIWMIRCAVHSLRIRTRRCWFLVARSHQIQLVSLKTSIKSCTMPSGRNTTRSPTRGATNRWRLLSHLVGLLESILDAAMSNCIRCKRLIVIFCLQDKPFQERIFFTSASLKKQCIVELWPELIAVMTPTSLLLELISTCGHCLLPCLAELQIALYAKRAVISETFLNHST